jgi:membrane protease YdiL (CAAX protease family)
MRVIPFFYELTLKDDAVHLRNLFAILLTPFTLTGITKFALAPFAEELLLRGVIYGYFRKKLGVVFGIFSQACISAILHLFYIKECFHSKELFIVVIYLILIHIVFSYLYEKTNSLYTSIICHGFFNYLLFIY